VCQGCAHTIIPTFWRPSGRVWRVLSCPVLCLLCVELLALHCASTCVLLGRLMSAWRAP
jgi:hypothetical protein